MITSGPTALAPEMQQLNDEIAKPWRQQRLEDDHDERILARLVEIARPLRLTERPKPPRSVRRLPLGEE